MTRALPVARALPIALLLAVAAAPAAPPAAAAEAKFSLELRTETPKVALGRTIKLAVALKSACARAVPVPDLKIGSPSNIVLYVRTGARSGQISRLLGKYSGSKFVPEPAGLGKELKRGETITGALDVPAIVLGKVEFTAVFLGLDRALQPEPLESKPVTVTVEPGPGGETRVGAKIRTSKGAMTAELYPARAYNTVNNFLTLAGSGFYSDRVFHRVLKDFMVQTGDPRGDGTGGPGWCIPAEFNDVKHEKGVLSMARESQHVNTAGSQFFIMHGTNPGLDRQYTAFGKVVEGMDVVDALATVPVRMGSGGEMSEPVERPKLEGVELVLLK
jgi:peptidyl-prolyl cis-trans isomerase B (cyclophilin B)